jgi:hypothetical protein
VYFSRNETRNSENNGAQWPFGRAFVANPAKDGANAFQLGVNDSFSFSERIKAAPI